MLLRRLNTSEPTELWEVLGASSIKTVSITSWSGRRACLLTSFGPLASIFCAKTVLKSRSQSGFFIAKLSAVPDDIFMQQRVRFERTILLRPRHNMLVNGSRGPTTPLLLFSGIHYKKRPSGCMRLTKLFTTLDRLRWRRLLLVYSQHNFLPQSN